jgi:transposase-like protein
MNAQEAASHLGIAVKTLYKWKRQARSNNGYLIFDGRAVRFRYRQTGAAGQGRILFELQWLDELKSAMEGDFPKQRRVSRPSLPNIHVELGVPQG